ncbi:ABC transporter ATP-binding protein [Demetria terragena]|uniref:ABC transporter ATP-binding protein n=1 Tax=Demetria terragena TaxID=63959 RepID=UPI00035F4832|nr:ABC transporter ATP-binding protein [Demetria terragena]
MHSTDTTTHDAPEAVITAHELRRTYGSGDSAYEAVRGLNLSIAPGEVYGLLGTNGAGKTSSLDVLEGLAAPTSGSVSVFGLDPVADRVTVRPRMGIMLQSGGLPAELTVNETLEMWRGTCSNPGDIGTVLAQVNLSERADVRVGSLSGGESRRVDLACALIGQPQLLFLDEPTTGLDPENRRATWQLLAALKESGVTMVLTTHYLDEAEALCDRISIMHRGEVAAEGTLRELVERHPATIAFDHPGLPLPELRDATIDAQARVRIETFHLQQHLGELLTWAHQHQVALGGLKASAASLESVFLSIADSDAHGDLLDAQIGS